MMGRRIYNGLFLAGIFFSAGAVYAAPVSSDRLDVLEKQAAERQREHKKLQAEAAQLNMDLTKLNDKLVSAAQTLRKQETATTQAEEKLLTLEKDLKVAEDKFAAENQKLAEMLAALQNLALHPTHSMIVMPLTPVEVVRSAVLMRDSVPYLNDNAQKIKADLDAVESKRKSVRTQLTTLKKQKEDLTKQQKELKKLVEQKTALRQKIEGESRKNKEEAAKLAAEASDLRDLLEKAAKEQELRRRKQEELRRAARQREEEARRKAEAERRQNGASAVADDEDSVSLTPSRLTEKNINFKAARGRLTKPVSGSVLTAYGEELSKGVSSKGLVIKTRAGAQVVAPYDGTVIFSGPFKGYGNLIIVEHGQGYVSLLAGMSSVDTETGQMVLTGEPVGVMPDQPSAKLYIEIRQNQRPINPAPWFGDVS